MFTQNRSIKMSQMVGPAGIPVAGRGKALGWYEDREITRQLPLLYRGLALYNRSFKNQQRGVARGGLRLLRYLIKVRRLLGLKTESLVRGNHSALFVDLCDQRILRVLGELRGHNEESRVIRSILREGDTFVDIGANHGTYSLLAAGIVGPKGRVLSFEPQDRLVDLIKRSFQANGLNNYRVYDVALSNQRGTAEFYIPAIGSGCAGLYERFSAASNHRRTQVSTHRLDELLADETMSERVFMKIDIEGSEYACLQGAERFLSRVRPTILFEVNPSSSTAAGHSVDELFDLLGSYGYQSFAEVDNYPQTIPLSEIDRHRPRNLLALPNS